jgi:TRAP-type C4-dicarboxylate transport system substrate-binding protein
MSVMLGRVFVALLLMLGIGTAAAQETKLILATVSQPTSKYAVFFKEWAAKVEAESKGAVSFDVRDGTALANLSNAIDRVANDVVQVAWIVSNLFGDKYHLSNVSGLPWVVDDLAAANIAQWRLYKSGAVDSEYRDMVPLWFGQGASIYLFFAKQPRSLTQLQGLKARIIGKREGELAQAMDMTPLSLPSFDQYQALQKGTVDLTVTSWESVEAWKLQEVLTHAVDTKIMGGAVIVFMARKKYESLPAAVRQAIDAHSGEAASREWERRAMVDIERVEAAAKSKMTVTTLPPDLQAKLQRTYAEPHIDAWLKKHPDAPKVLETYKRIYAEVRAGK